MNQNFGEAIEALKEGKRVARKGWNGKGMWLTLLSNRGSFLKSSGIKYDMQSCIVMKTADDLAQPGWMASQADMLAEDWEILEA